MACQIEHAFAATLAFEKIFMAFENDDPLDIFFCEAREAGEFGGHPAKIADHFAHGVFTLGVGPIRKGEPQVKLRSLSQLWLQVKEQARHGRGEAACQATRKDAQLFQNQPNGGEFEPFFHRVLMQPQEDRRATVCKRCPVRRYSFNARLSIP